MTAMTWLRFCLGALFALSVTTSSAAVTGWLHWRGPEQNGVSRETGLPATIHASNALWVVDYPGQSTPVIADGRVFINGYLGEGADLQEGIGCFDAETGELLWSRRYNDYLSDTIYLRYATASPAIDAETGNVYLQGTQGKLAAFSRDGELLWDHSLMEKFGRLTFPNARTATPLIDRDLVITRGITANWGAQGPASDRFYAYDKKTGELVWASTPGDRPKDNSYSHPQLAWFQGRRVFYAATGDGSVVCVNARTGEPLWRVPLFKAGINATVLVHNNDKIISLFGTPYELGRMVAFRIPNVLPTNAAGPVVVNLADVELWSADISTSTSHPILVGDTLYVVAEKGDLCAVDARTGRELWKLKIGIEQRNAGLLYADGRLYVPMLDDPEGKDSGAGEAGRNGAFYVIQPGERPVILSKTQLEGRCFGSPVAWNGKIYIQTTQKLYCFGQAGDNPGKPAPLAEPRWPAPGPATQLQIIPAEVFLHPGETATFRARKLDANGLTVSEVPDVRALQWTSYIPATARVRSTMKGAFDAAGRLVAAPDPVPSAGAFEASLDGLKGYIRGRVMPNVPLSEDFEGFTLNETNTLEGAAFAFPPLPWIGARFKFEVREREGNKCLVKTIDNKFFQRAMVFIGTPDMRNYTITADVLSDGTRRKMSEVGVIAQRYCIVLKGNEQRLEVNSNLERLRESVEFRWLPNVWYRLKARVDVAPDGTGVVRAKAWKRDDPEPAAWTLEVPHRTAHVEGSPGLFGFSPQDMRVYLDNITVTPTN
ncbi:MAG: PQQ-binding-like beta-propeller repeat protein [Limisphaerales bacterium]